MTKLSKIMTTAFLVMTIAVFPIIMAGCGEPANESVSSNPVSSNKAEVEKEEESPTSKETPKAETITFTNPAIEKYVRNLRDIPDGKAFTAQDAAGIRSFSVEGDMGTDFSDLAQFPKLGGINICDTTLSDISLVLKHCPAIESFGLLKNQSVTDLSPISNNQSITNVTIDASMCTDISPIGGLKKLQVITVLEKEVGDYSFIKDLTELNQIILVKGGTFDTAYLSNLTNLIKIDIRQTKLVSSDFSALKGLPSLSDISLRQCGITDISSFPSASMEILSKLNLAGNKITDVTALGELPAIRELNLSHNNITDVSALANITDTIIRRGIEISENPNLKDFSGLDEQYFS